MKMVIFLNQEEVIFRKFYKEIKWHSKLKSIIIY